jgi:hypothetical protein
MPSFALTATGLQTPRYPEARSIVVERWRLKFGANAQTASDSPDGLLIDVLALFLALLWESVANVHANSYLRTAAGKHVDLLLDLFGRKRLQPTSSTVTAIWYGEPEATVGAASIASVAGHQERRFSTNAEATTIPAVAPGGPYVFRIRGVQGNLYALTIGGVLHSITADDDDPVAVALQLREQLEADGVTHDMFIATDPDDLALLVFPDTGADVVETNLLTNVAADLERFLGVAVDMTALEPGSTAAAAGTLIAMETTNAGIEGVVNVEDANVGRDLELDPAYKRRHIDQRHAGGTGTAVAIRAKLLEAYPETLDYVRVFENVEDTTVDDLPPHSFQVVAIGEATDDEIASVIMRNKPLGIRPQGEIVTIVTLPEDGVPRTCRHSRGIERYLWLDVVLQPGEGFPTTGDPEGAVRAAIVEYLQPGGDGELGLGEDFYRYSLGLPINRAVPGLRNVIIETATTTDVDDPMPPASASDVEVDPDEILRVSSLRVYVHIDED